ELGLRHHALVATRGGQRRLVDEVHQVGAGEAGGAAGNRLQIDIGRQRNLADVNFQDLLAADDVRIRHHHLAVEPARTQQRAIRVLPVPGGPTSSTPRGIRPPRRWNLPGSRRNSTISCRSCLASSTPATSSKVTRPCASVSILARDLPKPIALPAPPCICRDRKIHTPISAMNGNQETSSDTNHGTLSPGRFAVI